MNLTYQKCYLDPGDIRGSWKILNVFLGSLNAERVDYTICSQNGKTERNDAVFYLHGLGGCLNDCPEIDHVICAHTKLIRVACFGLSNAVKAIGWATFGDVCALLHNSRQSLYSIANLLRLESYSVIAHSWGGFIACLTALNDPRCNKAMLLASTPDICDALSRMYELVRLPGPLRPLADIFMGKLRIDAENAKSGRSWHQEAWEAISPYGRCTNPQVQMLIFNRAEDRVMRRWNVEHFVRHARQGCMQRIRAEFIACHDLPDWHDMPPEKFVGRMEDFLFADA